jgi:trk system potassium uptake protein TrkA
MKSVVIGLGEFGFAAAVQLSRGGREVIAIDRSMELVERIKHDVAHAVCLDASDEHALEAQGVRDTELVIAAIGRNFEAQVLSVVHCKRLGAKRIVARATSVDHRRVLLAVGADEALNPEEEAARHVVQRLMIPDVDRYLELAEGFSVVEVRTPTAFLGTNLRDLDLRRRFRLNLVAIVESPKDGRNISRRFDPVPDPNRALTSADVLVLVGSDLDLALFVAASR